MEIFRLSKTFPKEETYSLTDQIRRASRSVPANIAEGYRKRLYPKHFVSKLSDADGESSETQVWLLFSRECGYITPSKCDELLSKYEEVGRMLGGIKSGAFSPEVAATLNAVAATAATATAAAAAAAATDQHAISIHLDRKN